MSAANKSFLTLFLFCVLTIIFFETPEKSEGKPQVGKSFRPHTAESLVQYNSFHSIANYNSNGKYESLPGVSSFWNSSSFDFAGRYVFDHDFAMNMTLNYNQVEANVGDLTKYSSSLQTLKIGMEKKIDSSVADFILEGVGQVSLLNINESSVRPPAGDGAHGFGGNIWILQRLWSTIYWHGKAGVLFRSEGLSGLAPYQLGLHGQIGSLTLSSILDGYFSLTPDSSTQAKRTTYLNKSSVGSYNYRSYNPNALYLDLQAQWQVTEQFGLNGGFGRTLFGKNSSHGTQFFIGVDIQWQTSQTFKPHNPFKNTMPSKSSKPKEPEEEELKSYPISL